MEDITALRGGGLKIFWEIFSCAYGTIVPLSLIAPAAVLGCAPLQGPPGGRAPGRRNAYARAPAALPHRRIGVKGPRPMRAAWAARPMRACICRGRWGRAAVAGGVGGAPGRHYGITALRPARGCRIGVAALRRCGVAALRHYGQRAAAVTADRWIGRYGTVRGNC